MGYYRTYRFSASNPAVAEKPIRRCLEEPCSMLTTAIHIYVKILAVCFFAIWFKFTSQMTPKSVVKRCKGYVQG